MTTGIEQSPEEVTQANQLYWSSDESVNRIANRLGLSKGSLYAAIKPKPSDSMCPTCHSQLVYANRTALERNTLSCLSCTHEFTVRPDRTNVEIHRAEEDAVETSADADLVPGRPDLAPGRPEPHDPPASRQLLLGTAFLALGTGLLLSRFVRRG